MKDDKQNTISEIIKEIEEIIQPEVLDDIFPDTKPYDDEIEDLIVSLISNIEEMVTSYNNNLEDIIEKLKSNYQNSNFWEKIREYVEKLIEPYMDVEFIRNMEDEDRIKFLDELIDNTIIYNEDIDFLASKIGVDVTKIEIGRRMLNTIGYMIIEKNFTKRLFYETSQSTFGFEEEDLNFIWDKYKNNKEQIQINLLFRKLNEQEKINDSIKRLIESFEPNNMKEN